MILLEMVRTDSFLRALVDGLERVRRLIAKEPVNVQPFVRLARGLNALAVVAIEVIGAVSCKI